MFKYCNSNPRELIIGDCVKRAIVIAANMEYATVERELNNYKKITGAESYNSDENPHRYVEEVLGAKKIDFTDKDGVSTVTGEFFCKFNYGHYILDMEEHWSACINGVIYDTWDCSKEIVLAAYEITPRKQDPDNLDLKTFYYKHIDMDFSHFIIVYRDQDGKKVEKKISHNALLGYQHCLKDWGYREVKV